MANIPIRNRRAKRDIQKRGQYRMQKIQKCGRYSAISAFRKLTLGNKGNSEIRPIFQFETAAPCEIFRNKVDIPRMEFASNVNIPIFLHLAKPPHPTLRIQIKKGPNSYIVSLRARPTSLKLNCRPVQVGSTDKPVNGFARFYRDHSFKCPVFSV